MKNYLLTLTLLMAVSMPAAAQQEPQTPAQVLFQTYDSYHVPYRIPAIVTTNKGHLIAVADRRYCQLDIGFGKIDLVARTSKDNGRSWSPDTVIQRGSGIEGSHDCGYGDIAMVADRTSKRILCMSVTGNVIYIKGTRENPNRVARWYSPDGGKSWTKAEDVTDAFYAMLPHTPTMFIGSGRIMQSRVVKKDKYYRLYCSVLTRTQMGDKDVACNYVIRLRQLLGRPRRFHARRLRQPLPRRRRAEDRGASQRRRHPLLPQVVWPFLQCLSFRRHPPRPGKRFVGTVCSLARRARRHQGRCQLLQR